MTVKKSNNKTHVAQSGVLKKLRLNSGMTQLDLATKLEISREKIVAIENCYLATMQELENEIIASWWRICKPQAEEDTKSEFRKLIDRIFPY
ncbi:transcriptional regulator [Paraneptunicella aestuarii]|uniref:transcriptional regulator n=1 Tax=Paraneptunicella aestuarii TaxID=2831148 RepID=UPI001E58DDFC|nr:transcriptional regulator [Paraneptunicella aestuarii]UAA37314.1 transcriptional regulator [Paraneptunicella aestuarii]